ncbi:hypothetical protein KGF56_003887 [Candida oxycetoniae]|uniref:UspA domain-containing protein n=1 Tax=Candida oxycetoniae TaxID=497107 RepID=A0AAI9SV71_9ASCO|nr:uncharacterized protein KGF56_003887 [Candida oxycetoniae]KAI3403299.2 hypothetical protein KGF56_003887 [Candida oxycetoniae]
MTSGNTRALQIKKPPSEGKLLKHDTKPAEDRTLQETETVRNTRLNASIYHIFDDSIDLYKQENNSSDLLGRLYYDCYDSDVISPSSSAAGTPILSPARENVGDGVDEDNEFHFGPLRNLHDSQISLKNVGLAACSNTSSSTSLNGLAAAQRVNSNSNSGARPLSSKRIPLERGITFDTIAHGSRKSLTLKSKHPQFKFRRNNKTWLVGFSNDSESTKAIEWLFDEMVTNGDTIIILQVLDEKKTPLSSIDKLQANTHLANFEKLNVHLKKIAIVFEVVIGKPQKCLKLAIEEYNPSMMVIGTHHYSEARDSNHHHRGFFSSSSLSKYFLEYALVPVIIVKLTYNYTEYLAHPIDSEFHFQNWIKNIQDHPQSAMSQSNQTHQMKKISGFLSPNSSKNSSFTNLAEENRGRKLDTESSRSRSTSRTKPFSKLFGKSDK